MAEEKMKGYPKIPRANWFAIRDRFKSKPPGEVTGSYLASVLNINLPSAKNLIPPLKALGLVGDDNRPTDLAFEWRHDDTYAEACHRMLDATYPQELRDLFTDPSTSTLQAVSTWFSRHTRSGEGASKMNAAMYLLLLEADLSKQDATRARGAGEPRESGRKVVKSSSPKREKVVHKHAVIIPAAEPAHVEQNSVPLPQERRGFSPKLHVDIQIHISPDSSAEQIDKIFESMAKHLPLNG
nr:DUF5343 domain-containing protein [Stenotrophomonas geniculata]